MKRPPDTVSASEIASWAWCPEAWRLQTLGVEPENRAELERGKVFHSNTAAFETRTRSASSLGWWLIALAALLLVAGFFLVRG